MAIAGSPAAPPQRKPQRRRARPWRSVSRHRADYLYVLPALLVMLVVIAYPIFYTV